MDNAVTPGKRVYINTIASGRNRSSQSCTAAAVVDVRQVRTDGRTACGAFEIESSVREKGTTLWRKKTNCIIYSSAHKITLLCYYYIYTHCQTTGRSVESFLRSSPDRHTVVPDLIYSATPTGPPVGELRQSRRICAYNIFSIAYFSSSFSKHHVGEYLKFIIIGYFYSHYDGYCICQQPVTIIPQLLTKDEGGGDSFCHPPPRENYPMNAQR